MTYTIAHVGNTLTNKALTPDVHRCRRSKQVAAPVLTQAGSSDQAASMTRAAPGGLEWGAVRLCHGVLQVNVIDTYARRPRASCQAPGLTRGPVLTSPPIIVQ